MAGDFAASGNQSGSYFGTTDVNAYELRSAWDLRHGIRTESGLEHSQLSERSYRFLIIGCYLVARSQTARTDSIIGSESNRRPKRCDAKAMVNYLDEIGRVAQLVEQCPFKAWVAGSSPAALTNSFSNLAVIGVTDYL
jgi:hypothetical protein